VPISTIGSQPATNSINAAYRPVELSVTATKTDGTAVPPVVYCDVYFNGTFYRTLSKSQYNTKTSTDSDWKFDIQDLIQEYLGKYIPSNGDDQIVEAAPLVVSIYCKFRSSGYNSEGFIVAEGVAPIQGTSDTNPVAGSGSQSNTFFGINATLQHYDLPDLASDLDRYKNNTWDPTTYPLTHRPNGYLICKGDSDWFPILTDKTPERIKLYYRQGAVWTNSEVTQCTSPSTTDTLPNATINVAYNAVLNLNGTAPFGVTITSKPAWMTISIVANMISFTGTPTVEQTESVDISITNCGTPLHFTQSFQVIDPANCINVSGGAYNPPDAIVGQAYNYTYAVTGTAPFTLSAITKPSWMTIGVSGSNIVLGGTPPSSAAATGVTVAFTVNNCGGNIGKTDTINVIRSSHLDLANYNGYVDTIEGVCTVNLVFTRTNQAQSDALAAGQRIRLTVNISSDNGCADVGRYEIFETTDVTITEAVDLTCGGGVYCTGATVELVSLEVIP